MTDAALARFNLGRLLDHWLGEVYRADVLGVGQRATAERLARDALAADQSLMAEAKTRIPVLEGVCRVRPNAYVEKKQLEYLKRLTMETADG